MLTTRHCLLLFGFLIPFVLNASPIDLTGPVLNGVPPDETVECDFIPAPPNVTATSDCPGEVTVSYSESVVPQACEDQYTIIRTWTAVDTCQQSVSASQTITVMDNMPPILTGVLPDETVDCGAIPGPATPFATDNCDVDPVITLVEYEVPNGACPFIFDLVREWTAEDNCGNLTTVIRTLTVQDVEAPVLHNVPPDMTVSCDAVPPPSTTVYAVDCDANVAVTFSETNNQGQGACPGFYDITRTWTAIDICGNVSNAIQVVSVHDTYAPIFDFVPLDTLLECGAAVPPPATLTATDNCSTATITFYESADGTCPDAHTITRSWTAEDECGNMESVVQLIVVDSVPAPSCQNFTSVINIVQEVLCAGGSDGILDVVATGGMHPYTFAWSTGQTMPTIDLLPAGLYDVTVTDSVGCVTMSSIVLNDPPFMTVTGNGMPTSGPGMADGAATAYATGGYPPYMYYWDNGMSGENITGLPAGNYMVTATDAMGCISTTVVMVDEGAPNCENMFMYMTIDTFYNGFPVSCPGANDGHLSAYASGGMPPYIHNWSTGATSPAINNVPMGMYFVTVTDAAGCVRVDSLELMPPPPLTAMTHSVPESYAGAGDGEVSVVATAGVGGFTYLWSNGATTEIVPNVSAGVYDVQVTDANGCVVNATEVVEVDTAFCESLTATVNVVQNILCTGGNEGVLDVVVTGGVPPYNFLWAGGQTVPTIDLLTADFYQVTVTDSIGCVATTSMYLMEPTPVHVIVSTLPESMNGQSDGQATATAFGGTAPYQFYWEGGATGAMLSDLAAGQYPVTVVDLNGCMDSTLAIVGSTDPGCMMDVIVTVSSDYSGFDLSCNNATDGEATAVATGGATPYTFIWDNGSTNPVATGLGMGSYTVTVTDANGCTISNEVTLEPPSSLVAFTDATPETSENADDGTATVTALGGAGGYMYLWSDAGASTSATIIDLAPGEYTVTITDANGCVFITSAFVDAIDPDSDLDGIVNSVDNCPTMYNPGQEDTDNDGQGDACTCDPEVATLVNTPGIHQSAYSSHDGVWTNYCTEGGELLISLALDGTGAVIPDDEVRVEIGSELVSFYGDSIGFVINGLGGVFLNRNWDVRPDVQPASDVGVRYYFHQSDFDELNNVLAGINAAPIPYITNMQFFKVTNPSLGMFPPLPTIPQGDLYLISNGAAPSLNSWVLGSHGAIDHYAEYRVSSFSGGGGGGAEGGEGLPVELMYFEGKLVGQSGHLKWATASEEDNLGFEIQRFNQGQVWETIGFVEGQGNSADVHTYEYRDMDIKVGVNYYRLKQVDFDGHYEHSDVVSIQLGELLSGATIYPNPALDKISVVDVLMGKAKIYDAYGNLVKQFTIDEPSQTIDVSALKDGMYFIEFDQGEKNRKTSRFYKSSTN